MAQKQCKKCLELKDLKDFYSDWSAGTYRSSCKVCEKTYQQQYQLKNKETVYAKMTARRLSKKQKAIELKGNYCFDCKQSFPEYIYDFHHLDESLKEYELAKLWQRSWEQIKEEVNKCILLCANCHRERHYGKKQN